MVIPHAICTRYLLAVGAKFVWLVRILMIMCYPTSYPIRKIMEILADNLLELVIGSTRTLIPYQSSIPTISSTISEGCEGPDSELMLSMIGLLVPVVSCGRRYM